MVNKDFFQALDALEQEKGIDKDYFIDALESALASAYKRNFSNVKQVEVVLKPEKYSIEMYAYQNVVAEVVDPNTEIALNDVEELLKNGDYKILRYDEESDKWTTRRSPEIGDRIAEAISPKDFGRIAAGTAKQVITQKIREKEKNSAYGEFEGKVDTIQSGIVDRIEAGVVYVQFSQTQIEGVMNEYDQIKSENYNVGDRIKVYIKKLRETNYGVQAIVSRSSPLFVKKLFELEIPEITQGTVQIVNIVREVGYRTKISMAFAI